MSSHFIRPMKANLSVLLQTGRHLLTGWVQMANHMISRHKILTYPLSALEGKALTCFLHIVKALKVVIPLPSFQAYPT